MLFDEGFIEWVDNNPVEGISRICSIALEKQADLNDGREWSEEEHEVLWEAATFIDLVSEKHSIKLDRCILEPSLHRSNNCRTLVDYIQNVSTAINGHLTQLKVASYRNRYSAALKAGFAYEFSTGDLDRVQSLINELRTKINECDELEDDHKQRLLNRLEKLQSEVHKRVSDLDRFWGLVGDAGIVLGKLGDDAKPIVDRVKELAQIVWRTQARAEELPSGASNPMLESDEES